MTSASPSPAKAVMQNEQSPLNGPSSSIRGPEDVIQAGQLSVGGNTLRATGSAAIAIAMTFICSLICLPTTVLLRFDD
jgi:hypothetical protein